MEKTYNPQPIEEKYTKLWQDKRLFTSKVPEDKNKKSFVIVIPPPNITGALHMGHALNNTLQDILIRSHRMFGMEAYWVPGTDHGGIATQNVIEKKLLAEQKLKRQDLGREKFLEIMWNWYKECGDTILMQLNKLGCALDLNSDNVRFTMDEHRAKSVHHAFEKLWNKKLIYRGERMINWCVRCTTALSDAEVEHEQAKSKLWHIKYPLEDGSGHISVATTRPETMLGDTAVAVHPSDERHKNLIGKKLKLPLTDRTIPIVADEMVEKEFGTGAVKITPAHDPNDFETGQRHKLETIKVISYFGKMINVPEKYLGLNRTECRKQVVADLEEQGFLEKEEPYFNAVSACYRCHQPIEPLVSEQWFVKMQDLAKPAIKVLESGEVTLHPDNWKKPLLAWLNNIQDWCISRQIWWGHRIPVWYCEACSGEGLIFSKTNPNEIERISFKNGAKPIISFEKPKACPDCKGHDLYQDPDVLDTWFSSGLWPFSVFNWPDKSEELDFYYPTSVLSTGYEIIYLWVARMIMLGLEFMGKVPFNDVYLHGIIRDKHGKKMSKSLGNVVNPLDLIFKYGTDAVRFSLVSQAYPGKDIPFGEESIVGARNLCNKLYNAGRFIIMNLPEKAEVFAFGKNLGNTTLADKWILSRYTKAINEAKTAIENYNMSLAANTLYGFFWDEFCDWYLELSKPRLQAQDKHEVLSILVNVYFKILKAFHPIMPFITEELANAFRGYVDFTSDFLLQEEYPKPDAKLIDEKAEADMEIVKGIITSIRTVRAQFGVVPALEVNVFASVTNAHDKTVIEKNLSYITQLAKIKEFKFEGKKPSHSATAVFREMSFYIPLEGIIDFEKEKQRLTKELQKQENESQTCAARLADKVFKTKAPAHQVEKIQKRLVEANSKIEQIKKSLKDIE
jgi:valyl-tRNA synthetase